MEGHVVIPVEGAGDVEVGSAEAGVEGGNVKWLTTAITDSEKTIEEHSNTLNLDLKLNNVYSQSVITIKYYKAKRQTQVLWGIP